jgi:hypothetical protein
MELTETLQYWTFDAAVQRAIEHYRTTVLNDLDLPYQASQACRFEASEASYSGENDLACVQLLADLMHAGVLALARRGVAEEEIAAKALAPLIELGLTADLGPEKQQILDRRYADALVGLPTIAE